MKHITLGLIAVIAIIGMWLCMWDIADFLTTGINEGIWDIAIIQNGLPSVLIGLFLVIACTVLGFNIVLRGG